MFVRILTGFDNSERARDAIALAKLIRKETGAELLLAAVLPEDPLTGRRDARFSETDARLERALREAAEPVGARPITIVSRSPARGLHRLAEQRRADLLVLGSAHHGGLRRAVAGTTAQRLLHGSPCAVAVTSAGFREDDPGLRVLAVGYDGSPESTEALAAATALGLQAGATLRILSNADPQGFSAPVTSDYPANHFENTLRAHFQHQLDAALVALPSELRASGALLRGEVATALRAEAEKGVDLLFVGSRGYGPLRRVLLGSVSYALIEATPCPLIVVPRGAFMTPRRMSRRPVAPTP